MQGGILNLSSEKSFAEFLYEFSFDGHTLVYRYKKSKPDCLLFEDLLIDDKEVICFDHLSKEGFTKLKGSETLNHSLCGENSISRVRFVDKNAILLSNEENKIFYKFIDFVHHMLLFYSLDSKGYEGFQNGSVSSSEIILEKGS